MPSRSKKTQNIVVRPITRGADAPTKTVLATLTKLNNHEPVDKITAHLKVYEPDPRPWKKASRSSYACSRDWQRTARRDRRNPGRDDGTTYTSSRFLCEPSMDHNSILQQRGRSDADVGDEWEAECARLERDPQGAREREQIEVAILDIAKPAKRRRRGAAKDYEMINTVQRVIALDEDDSDWQWEIGSEDLDYVDWEAVEDEVSVHDAASYAGMVQHTAG
ncbi:hypothetical protein C8Q74DRAFT_1370305 [Fomes fomentarius]|nr:hypothetical protein C8Q74DRAFT_1370305 [Fomes fomentarius]